MKEMFPEVSLISPKTTQVAECRGSPATKTVGTSRRMQVTGQTTWRAVRLRKSTKWKKRDLGLQHVSVSSALLAIASRAPALQHVCGGAALLLQPRTPHAKEPPQQRIRSGPPLRLPQRTPSREFSLRRPCKRRLRQHVDLRCIEDEVWAQARICLRRCKM